MDAPDLGRIFSNEIFIVDDDEAVCALLSLAFRNEGYRVTLFNDAISFITEAKIRSPGCILLDVHMPGKSGLDVLTEIDAEHYPVPIVMMSGRSDIPIAVKSIKNGAFGFIEKGTDAGSIVRHVRDTIIEVENDLLREANLRNKPLSQSFEGSDRLTPREQEVLNQITSSASNKVAARNLGISYRTVEIHRTHIMQKLGAKNAVDLIRIVLGVSAT